MRVVLGALSLLLVLVIVGALAKRQLQALNQGVAARSSIAASQARVELPAVQQQIRDDVTRALQQGADRAAHAEP
jgi:competence protein ComGC